MKPISRDELLPLGAYEQIRDSFRARIIELKKARRVQVHPDISLLFENRDTMLLQVQEMLRTERITNEKAIAHEIETYNQLVPQDNELSATLFIEIPEHERREEMLVRWCAIEEHIAVVIDGVTFRATFEEGRRDQGRAAAVQYLKFPISAAAISALHGSNVNVAIDHRELTISVALEKRTIASLAADFS